MKGKSLFLLDAVGAIVSAFFLGVVLVYFQPYIGKPTKILYLLAAIPCVFLIYDLLCYFYVKHEWPHYLKGIAFANLAYCLLSIGSIVYYYKDLTTLGLSYFILEILVIFVVVYLELKAASKTVHQPT